ncbi:hypothetical protein KEM55_009002 [Ascosphaera atra]|nr:hypothetical protein KEM55_009002 [Ascosphaera atra]
MSLNMAHELVATRNVKRVQQKRNKSIQRRRRESQAHEEYEDDDEDKPFEYWGRPQVRGPELRRYRQPTHGLSQEPGHWFTEDGRLLHHNQEADLAFQRQQGGTRHYGYSTAMPQPDTRKGEELYDVSGPRQPDRVKSRKHKLHKSHRPRHDEEFNMMNSPARRTSKPSPAEGIGAALAIPTGIVGGIAGVEGEWDEPYRNAQRRDSLDMALQQEPWNVQDVKRSREYRKNEQKLNLASLDSLAQHSQQMTGQLDDINTSIPNRISNLHAAVYAFRELLDLAIDMRSRVSSQISDLQTDSRERLRDLHDFNSQVQMVEQLQERMDASKHRAAELNQRLASAREAIREWQQDELEWNRVLNRRLKVIVGVVMTSVVVLVIYLVIGFGWPTSGGRSHVPVMPVEKQAKGPNADAVYPAAELLAATYTTTALKGGVIEGITLVTPTALEGVCDSKVLFVKDEL